MTKENDSPERRPIAFFDFDGTLTKGDTLMPFLKFVVGAPKYYTKLALVSPVLMAYFARLLRNDIAKQVVLKQYLAGYHIDSLRELGQRFSEEVIPAMLRPEGMERLALHQKQGHECVLVSASLDLYLDPWSEKLKFNSFLSSRLEINNHLRVTGRLSGDNCFGKEKVQQILANYQDLGMRTTYAYGDSQGDRFMLSLVDFGFLLSGEKFIQVEGGFYDQE